MIVHLPDAGVVFTGDLVFHGGHPIIWAGPVGRWIDACDRMLALDADRRRPRPRPARATPPCIRDQRDYLEWLLAEGTPRLEGGMSRRSTPPASCSGPGDQRGEGERLMVNVTALARDLGLEPTARRPDPVRRHGRSWPRPDLESVA